MTYGDQPGYNNASSCGAGHGTFGYLGEQGFRHDLGQGDTTYRVARRRRRTPRRLEAVAADHYVYALTD